jgi:hypothetical protein
MSTKPKKIKAVVGLTKMGDGNITPLLDGALKGLTTNATIYPKPPVDLPTLEATINAYKAAIPVAIDGSKTAIAQKNKLRDIAVKFYTLNAHYVEATCGEDMATFLLSGYQAVNPVKAAAAPLPVPSIEAVVQGPNSGQLKVTIAPLPKVVALELRHGAVPAGGGTPAAWIQEMIATKKPVIYENLTPGTVYMFQVRAFGRLGFTDWSDPVSRMVT